MNAPLGSPHGGTHLEAVLGLARRRDERAVPPLVKLLQDDSYNPCLREAAQGLLGGGAGRVVDGRAA